MEKIIANLKPIILMKASGKTDREIADYVGMPVKTFLDKIESEPYIKEQWENATDRFVSDIEMKFLQRLEEEVEMGEMSNAKWFLERRSEKYKKNETVDVNVRSIDDIIKEKDK